MGINEFIDALKKIQDKRGDVDVIVAEDHWSNFHEGNGPRTIFRGTDYFESATMDDLLPVVNGKIIIKSRSVWWK